MEGRDKGEGEGWNTRESSRRGARSRNTRGRTRRADRMGRPYQAGRLGGPGRSGRACGLLKRASCVTREEVSSDSLFPKSI
eukprot:8411279-Pyramimonas_sp.AAC.1